MFNTGYGIEYSNQTITVKYQDKEYLLIFEKNGKVSGDRNIFCTVNNYSCKSDYNIFDKWKQIDKNTIQLTNAKGNEYFKIFFFKDKLLILYPDKIDSANKKLLDYDSNFKNNLSNIELSNFYNDNQLAFFRSEPFIRYISSEVGLQLRAEPSTKSNVIDTMNYGDKFFITKLSGKTETIAGRNGQWVQGYWRCEKGWAFDAFMQDTPLKDLNSKKKKIVKNYKRGFITYSKTKIYEIPDKTSRVIGYQTWDQPIMVFTSDKKKSGWLYIETIFSQNLTGKNEPIIGCVEEKNICFEEQFQKVNEFKPVKISGCFGDSCESYTFKNDATCIIEDLGSPYDEPSIIGVYNIYRFEELYMLKNEKGLWTLFRFKNGRICGLDDDYMCN